MKIVSKFIFSNSLHYVFLFFSLSLIYFYIFNVYIKKKINGLAMSILNDYDKKILESKNKKTQQEMFMYNNKFFTQQENSVSNLKRLLQAIIPDNFWSKDHNMILFLVSNIISLSAIIVVLVLFHFLFFTNNEKQNSVYTIWLQVMIVSFVSLMFELVFFIMISSKYEMYTPSEIFEFCFTELKNSKPSSVVITTTTANTKPAPAAAAAKKTDSSY